MAHAALSPQRHAAERLRPVGLSASPPRRLASGPPCAAAASPERVVQVVSSPAGRPLGASLAAPLQVAAPCVAGSPQVAAPRVAGSPQVVVVAAQPLAASQPVAAARVVAAAAPIRQAPAAVQTPPRPLAAAAARGPDAGGGSPPYALELVRSAGVDLSAVPAARRRLPLVPEPAAAAAGAAGSQAQVARVGRELQPEAFEAWLPDEQLRTCVSRTAFDISWSQGTDGAVLWVRGSSPIAVDGRAATRDVGVALSLGAEISFNYTFSASGERLGQQQQLAAFLVLRFGATDSPVELSAAPVATSPIEVSAAPPPLGCTRWRLSCIHSEGLPAERLADLPQEVRHLDILEGTTLLGRVHQCGMFDALLSESQHLLPFISRTHVELTVGSAMGPVSAKNVSTNPVWVDWNEKPTGSTWDLRNGQVLSFCRPQEGGGGGKYHFLALQVRDTQPGAPLDEKVVSPILSPRSAANDHLQASRASPAQAPPRGGAEAPAADPPIPSPRSRADDRLQLSPASAAQAPGHAVEAPAAPAGPAAPPPGATGHWSPAMRALAAPAGGGPAGAETPPLAPAVRAPAAPAGGGPAGAETPPLAPAAPQSLWLLPQGRPVSPAQLRATSPPPGPLAPPLAAGGAGRASGTTSPMQTPPSPGSVAPPVQLVAAAAAAAGAAQPASCSPPVTTRACEGGPAGPILTQVIRGNTSPGRLPSPKISPRGPAGEPSCAQAPVPTQVRPPPRAERPSLLPWELGLDCQDRHAAGSPRAPGEIVLELAGDGVLDVPLPQRCLGPISSLTALEFVVGRRHQPELHRVAVAKECLPFLSRDHFSIAQVGGGFRLRSLTDNTMWLVRDGDSPLELRRGSEAAVKVGDRIALVTGGDVVSSATAEGACRKLCWHVRPPSVLEGPAGGLPDDGLKGSGGGWRGAARGGADSSTPPRPAARAGLGTPPSPGALLPRFSDLAPWNSGLRDSCTPQQAAVPKSAPPMGLSESTPPRGWAGREERLSELWSPAPRMLPQTQEAAAPPSMAFSPAPRAAAPHLEQLPEDTTARFGYAGETRDPGGSLREPDVEPPTGRSFLHKAATTRGSTGEGTFWA